MTPTTFTFYAGAERRGRRRGGGTWRSTGTENPALTIETLTVQRYRDVTEEMALAEGENDDLEGWRRVWLDRSGGWRPEM